MQRALLTAAAAAFVGVGWWAWSALDLSIDSLHWGPLLVAALIGVPMTAATNAAEYVVSARVLGHRIPVREAMVVSVLSTAANLLPIPGAVVVRVQRLRMAGSSYRGALSSTLFLGLAWIGTSAVLAGVWLLIRGSVTSWIFLPAGVAVIAGSYRTLARHRPPGKSRRLLLMAALLIELAAVAVDAFRIFFVIEGLGMDANPSQAFVLAMSSSLASAAGIFPGGLGIREAISALLAPLAGLPPSVGFLAAAVNRVIGIVVHSPITLALVRRTRSHGEPVEGPRVNTSHSD